MNFDSKSQISTNESRTWICTTELDSDFPYAINSLYVGKSTGRYPWLHRRPGATPGRRGRYLWINITEFNAWAVAIGIKFRFKVAGDKGGAA